MRWSSKMRTAAQIALILRLFTIIAEAQDWPQFLGPNQNSTSQEVGLIQKWPPTGPKLKWQKPVGTGYSAPSTTQNKVIVHHRKADREIVDCLDAQTGDSIWTHSYVSSFVDPYGYNNGPRCSPLLYNGRCFTFGAEGKLLCLDLASGSKIWEKDTHSQWTIPEAFFGVGSSPIICDDKLIVMIGGQPNSGVIAFDPATGKTLWESVGGSNWQSKPMHGWPGELKVDWKVHEKQASYSSPVVATIHGKKRIYCLMRQGLVSIDPSNGKVIDSFWFRARVNESVNASNPVITPWGVFISSAYYRSGSVMLEVDSLSGKFIESWRSMDLETHWMTPILVEGHLYAFSGRNEPDARFRCLDLATKKLKWDQNEAWQKYSDTANSKYGRGSILYVDNKLIVLGETGLLGMFQPSSQEPKELCRYKSPLLKYPCWTAPIVSQKTVFLRSEEWLLAYDFSPP